MGAASTSSSLDVAARRARAAAAWGLTDECVVVFSGRAIPIPGGADQCFPFRAHPDHRWLAGRGVEGGVVAFDPREGWSEFLPGIGEAERLWEGREDEPLGEAQPMSRLEPWLVARAGRPLARLGATEPSMPPFDAPLARRLGELLLHARRPKDEHEIALMRRAAAATAAGFARARELVRPGISERAIAIEIEAAMFRAGGERTAYETIVASGPRSAILHGLPTERIVGPGDIVLVDAGVEVGGYCADVTRVVAAPGPLMPERRALCDLVASAQRRAIERCRPGVAWRDVHTATAHDLAAGLAEIGLVRGGAAEIVASETIALFLPHGVGHMFGLGVRDAGGRLPAPRGHDGRPLPDEEPRTCCGVALRVDLPLEIGYAMTVEPGLYLVPALLGAAQRRERFARQVDWALVDRWLDLGVGGVRIEDDVIVRADGPEILTREIPVAWSAVA
ncbi:MAG: M24 family metallopeptidase [Phycisphaerales bacterium]